MVQDVIGTDGLLFILAEGLGDVDFCLCHLTELVNAKDWANYS